MKVLFGLKWANFVPNMVFWPNISAHGRKLTILFSGSQALIHAVWAEGQGPRSWDENCLRKVCPDHAGQSAEDGEEGRQSEDKQDGNVETTAPRRGPPVQSSPTDSFTDSERAPALRGAA